MLKRIKETGDIFMAWSDEPWILDGAAVRISIIGFDDGSASQRMLDGTVVEAINSDLTASVDITTARVLKENAGISFTGDQPTGPFDVPAETARHWLSEPVNVNGRPNSDVVKRYWTGKDIVQRWSERWIVDFGVDVPEQEAAYYESPYANVKEHVRPVRMKNSQRVARDRWWIHWRARPDMRAAISGICRYVVTPHVSKHRIFAWLPADDLANNLLIVFARDDDYFFGVLHSRAHEVWSLRMGTWLGKGNDPRYTPTTTFETFPLPWPPGQEPADDPRVVAIAQAAERLNALRENWLNPPDASEAELKKRTLTNLYNARPTWLANAHAALDRTVWDAYGWPGEEVPGEVAEDVILARLLALNGERAARA